MTAAETTLRLNPPRCLRAMWPDLRRLMVGEDTPSRAASCVSFRPADVAVAHNRARKACSRSRCASMRPFYDACTKMSMRKTRIHRQSVHFRTSQRNIDAAVRNRT